jgi:hypothetical protein
VNRDTVLWTLVVFFGASILFAAVRDATKDEGTGVALLAQLAVGALLVGAIVVFIRRRG